MSYHIYSLLHLVSVFLLVGFTFYAFAGPAEKTRRSIMIITGIASVVILVSGFGMLAKLGLGFPGWVILKLLAWLGLSAFAGIAYRNAKQRKNLLIVSIVLICLAVWAVVMKPF